MRWRDFIRATRSSSARNRSSIAATKAFTDRATAQVNSNLINFAATATFVVDEDTAPLSVKITWVIAREDGDWKIVSHHVSSQTPLL
jgi:hypothetical protein